MQSLLRADSEGFDQNGQIPRLVCVFVSHTDHFFDLSYSDICIIPIFPQKWICHNFSDQHAICHELKKD